MSDYPNSTPKRKGCDIERLIKEIESKFFGYEVAVFENIEPFAQLLKDNPKTAIARIREVYEATIDRAYGKDRVIVDTFAGGPIESLNYPLYNAVGAVYPYLDREARDDALRGVLSILDFINCVYVQEGHTNGIREPLLLADIVLCRGVYWPGYEWETSEVKKYAEFATLQAERMGDRGLFNPRAGRSDFLMACAILFDKDCPFREEYARAANPIFLERVVRAVVAIDLGAAPPNRLDEEKIKVQASFPPSLRDRVEKYYQEGGWVDRTKFGRPKYYN